MTVSTKTYTKIVPANPFLVCDECGERVEAFKGGEGPPTNLPCGHGAGYSNPCYSWDPVDGCICEPGTH